MDPVMEPIFTKMIPCPGVRILKMIPCSAAGPRTEKYMSTPPPPTGKVIMASSSDIDVEQFLSDLPSQSRRAKAQLFNSNVNAIESWARSRPCCRLPFSQPFPEPCATLLRSAMRNVRRRNQTL